MRHVAHIFVYVVHEILQLFLGFAITTELQVLVRGYC